MSKKENLKRVLVCVSIITLGIFAVSMAPASAVNKKETTKDTSVAYSKQAVNDSAIVKKEINYTEVQKDSIKKEIVSEVKNYIAKCTKNRNTSLAESMVDHALSNNFDLCFMMCQTKCETNFGTAGIGRVNHRKSLFGVYQTYSSYDACIKYYVNLVKTKYMGSKKSEMDLLKHYVTLGGHRYAEGKGYEQKLSKEYQSIKTNTNIYALQQRYKKLS